MQGQTQTLYSRSPMFGRQYTTPTSLTTPPPLTMVAGQRTSYISPVINNTVEEVATLLNDNNNANYHADKLIRHIVEYGESNMLLEMLSGLSFEMKDFILMKVAFHFAYRLEILKLLVPLSLYSLLGDSRAEDHRNKHIKQVLHILKYMDRSDLIKDIRERFGDIVLE